VSVFMDLVLRPPGVLCGSMCNELLASG
jgi:hypothetical protein